MTTKETVLKAMLEDEFSKKVVNLKVVEGVQTAFDIAESYTQEAINLLGVNANGGAIQTKACELIFASLGYFPQ